MDPLKQRQLQQLNQQQRALSQEPELVYRIGDRDPVTGKYTMIFPDGSKAVGAEKLYSAESQPGDRVLAQKRTDGVWLLSEASPNARRRSSTPDPLPSRVPKRSRVYVLYELDGGLWVGGHQAAPSRIADRPANLLRAWVWGDPLGWEVSLTRGNSNQPDITAISSRGGIAELNGTNAYMHPIGAGYWDVLNRDRVFVPANDGVQLYGGANRSFTFGCDVGYWSAQAGYVLDRASESVTELEPENQNSETNLTINTTINCPLAPSGKRATSTSTRIARFKLSPPVSNSSLVEDTTRAWMADRYSSLAVRTTRASINAALQFAITREYEGRSEQIGQPSAALPYGAAGADFLYVSFAPPIAPRLRWDFAKGLETFRNVAPFGGSYTPNATNPTQPPTRDLCYTNGKMIAMTIAEIDKLKIAPQNVDVAEVSLDATEAITPVFAYSIPANANILAYCGSLV